MFLSYQSNKTISSCIYLLFIVIFMFSILLLSVSMLICALSSDTCCCKSRQSSSAMIMGSFSLNAATNLLHIFVWPFIDH